MELMLFLSHLASNISSNVILLGTTFIKIIWSSLLRKLDIAKEQRLLGLFENVNLFTVRNTSQ